MNPIDFAVILFLIAGFIWGFSKGFIYMVFSLIAIILGVFGAAKLTPLILNEIFHLKNDQVWSIVLFILIFTLIYFVIRKLSYVFEDMIQFLELEWLDSLLGALIGLLQFLLIAGILITLAYKTEVIRFIPNYKDIRFSLVVSDVSGKIIDFIAGNIGKVGIHQNGINL